MSRALLQRAAVPVGQSSATAIAWQFKGETRVTAIVKAAFTFSDDGAMLRAPPPPILREDLHHGGNPMRSVVFASDLAPYKRQADVLFTGHAHPPAVPAAASATVRLGLADGARTLLDKALVVRKPGGFQKLRLLYEHAVGGPGHDENPFGEDLGDDPEDPPEDLYVFHPSDPSRAAGFAPVPPVMLPRKRVLGSRPPPAFGLTPTPLPDTFPFDFFQVAPADQRVEHLRGDEQIVLAGLHPRVPLLRARLPGAQCAARLFGLSAFGIADGRPLAMYADTLHVSGDDERCLVTWRGSFAVPSVDALGSVRIAAAVETPDAPAVWPSREELEQAATAPGGPASAPSAPGASTQTLQLSDDDIEVVSSKTAATLPLTPAAALAAAVTPFKSAAALTAATAPPGSSPAVRIAAPSAGTETLPVPSRVARGAQGSPLPFQPAASGTPPVVPPAAKAARPAGSAGATLPLPSYQNRASGPALPFGAQQGRTLDVSNASADELLPEPPAAAPPDASSPASPAAAPPATALPTAAAAPTAAPVPPRGLEPEGAAPQVEVAASAPRAPAPAAAAARPPETAKSPWAAPDEAPPAPPRAPQSPKKLPPRVDVHSKLYGSKKKGR